MRSDKRHQGASGRSRISQHALHNPLPANFVGCGGARPASSVSRYVYPRLRATRYARVVRTVARAVVPVARNHLVRRVIREDRPEPEPKTSIEIVPVEVVSFMPAEVMSLGARVLHASTGVTVHASTAVTVHASTAVAVHASTAVAADASTAVTAPASTAVTTPASTAPACRLAGRVDGQQDSQYDERHHPDLFRNHNRLHVMPRFSYRSFGWRRWQEDSPRPAAGALHSRGFCKILTRVWPGSRPAAAPSRRQLKLTLVAVGRRQLRVVMPRHHSLAVSEQSSPARVEALEKSPFSYRRLDPAS